MQLKQRRLAKVAAMLVLLSCRTRGGRTLGLQANMVQNKGKLEVPKAQVPTVHVRQRQKQPRQAHQLLRTSLTTFPPQSPRAMQ